MPARGCPKRGDLLDRGSRGRPLQPATVGRVRAVVHACLDQAVKKGELAHNPAAYADPVPSKRRERPWWGAEEPGRLLPLG
jgi:hypothetical protein